MAVTTAQLELEDGTLFQGKSFGAVQSIAGEVVFNTGMVGYPENLTDPSYAGQILTLTYPLIGNYGVPSPKLEKGLLQNFESDRIHISGLIISDYSFNYSHWDAETSLAKWLKAQKIPALYDVDTRSLTTTLRRKGSLLGRITFDEQNLPFSDPNKRNLVADVSTKVKVIYQAEDEKYRVLLIDCGVKYNIIRCLLKRGATVIRVPWDYDPELEPDVDAIFISNGPGDPKQCQSTVMHLKKSLGGDKPIFGICLGNQLLALAAGADTYKLKFGHRSQNQPCMEQNTTKCNITSQNHGFAVDETSLPKGWVSWFHNLNDGSNEGIKHLSKPFYSVQFHPESSAGPVDTEFLFDHFVNVMEV